MTSTENKSSSNRPHGSQPKMYFSFDQVSGELALQHITELTSNFNENSKLEADFVENLQNTLNETETLLHGYLYAPRDSELTRQVIGKNGCYFHKTTKECSIYFIWHNRNTNRFEFWGQKKELIKAMSIIRSRILKTTQSTSSHE